MIFICCCYCSLAIHPCPVLTVTKGKFYFFRIVYALSACVGGMGIVIVVLACYACRRRSNLKRKSSDQEINQGYDPDTEDVSVLYEEFDDRIKFIRNCCVDDGVRTGFSEEIEDLSSLESQDEFVNPVVHM